MRSREIYPNTDVARVEAESDESWEFAFAVFTLNRNPMHGLLQLAGMKPRRPRWDGLLLIVTALLPMVAIILLVLWNADATLFRSVGIGSGCIAIMLLMFFASRRIKKQQLERDIERCRLASRFVLPLGKKRRLD